MVLGTRAQTHTPEECLRRQTCSSRSCCPGRSGSTSAATGWPWGLSNLSLATTHESGERVGQFYKSEAIETTAQSKAGVAQNYKILHREKLNEHLFM